MRRINNLAIILHYGIESAFLLIRTEFSSIYLDLYIPISARLIKACDLLIKK